MKKFLNLFTAILFISTAILMSCGGTGGGDPEPTQQELTGKAISKGTATPSTITLDNTSVSDDWTDFTISFTLDADFKGGNYTTSGSLDASVWPASGKWAFDGDSTSKIIRDGTTSIDVTANETTLSLGFNVPKAGGRVLTFDGNWSFVMSF